MPRRELVRPYLNNDKLDTDNDVVSEVPNGDGMELMGGDIEGIFDADAPADATVEGEDLSIFGE